MGREEGGGLDGISQIVRPTKLFLYFGKEPINSCLFEDGSIITKLDICKRTMISLLNVSFLHMII